MTKVLVLIMTVVLSACAGSSGGGGASPASLPTTTVDGGRSTDPVTQPVTDTTSAPAPAAPTPTPVPPAPTPTPAPTPAPPVNLTCYNNAGVFCTGANLTSNVVQLDLEYMFTGYNPQLQVTVTSLQNNVSANAHAVCAQPNGAGCYQHSVCVTGLIMNAGTHSSYSYTWCGNVVNTQFRALVDQ